MSIWIKNLQINKTRLFLKKQKCKKKISNKIRLGGNLNPLRDVTNVPFVDNVANLRNVFSKVDKLGNLWDKGEADADLARYIPGLTDASRQRQIYKIEAKKAYAGQTYVGQKTLEFTVTLAANTYTNYSSVVVVLPIQINKKTDKMVDIDATMITVNNFLSRWPKEVDIKRYPDDVRITPTNNTVSIADYSAQIMKHRPNKSLDITKKTLLYDKEGVYLPQDRDRRQNNTDTEADRTDKNLGSRIIDFHEQLAKKNFYRIPLKFFTDLGLVNFTHNTDTKFIFMLEINLNKQSEQNKKEATTPRNTNAQIIFHDHPYIQYQQILLDDNFLAYLNASLRSKTALQMGIFNAPCQQSFEMNVGAQSRKVNFYGFPSQFEFIEISKVYDRSEQHQTTYDSYDLELAARNIQSITLENVNNTYSITGTLEYNVDNEDDKHSLYVMFIAHNCSGCSAALLTQDRNNEIYQELKSEEVYFGNESDEKIYIDMKRSKGYTDELEKLTRNDNDISVTVKLKAAATKKLRLKIVGYLQCDYFYTTSNHDL